VLTVETPTSGGHRSRNYQTANNARNTLIGGAGDDRLVGGLGSERYVFNRGDGHDTIRDRDFYNASTDQIVLGEGISQDELSLRRDGNHMVLVIGGGDSGDSITIEEAYVNSEYRIEELVFADGTKLAGSKLFELAMLGTAEDDDISASGFSEKLDGKAGNDTLRGGAGNDQLFGGEGNDTLIVSHSGSNTLDGV
ncbi:calcium-binding protein, partial [Vibrio chagasii]|uniref:calcium-binding protein n=1 Tax=Vibrio chagasii TaxID=170679 RepID=UPI00354B38CD